MSLCMCVCVFVCSCVRSHFLLLVYLEFNLVLKSFNGVSRKFEECLEFQGCFQSVLRVLAKSFNEGSGIYQGCSKKVSRVFQVRLNCVSSNFKGLSIIFKISLQDVSGKFQECFKEVSKKFQECFNKRGHLVNKLIALLVHY